MICPKCGSNQADGTVFCSNCGNDMRQANATQQPYGQQPYGQQQYTQQPYAQQPYAQQGGIISERSIAVAIILSIVTCGIYGLYWLACMASDLNQVSGDNSTSGGMVVLLTIVTCGIYGYYWMYKAGQQIAKGKTYRGLVADKNAGILYLILAIFRLSIVSYALIQNELNSFAR